MSNDQQQAGFRVSGRVQGVGFRWWTRQTAERLGLAGSVRNLSDGSVEIRAAGSRGSIRRLEALLHEGPRTASIDRVERFPVDAEPYDGFRIEP